MDTFDKTTLAFLLGATTGALTGLLLAPASGANTRHRISETAHDVLDEAETAWEEGSERVKDIADTVVHEVKSIRE